MNALITMNRYQLLNDCIIRIGQTEFHPWPDFRITGLPVEIPSRLAELLTAAEVIPMLWRAKIPDELLQLLKTSPASELERLLHLSQLDYDRVLDWLNFCPALLVLAPGWSSGDPLSALEAVDHIRKGWRHILNAADWPVERSTLNVLRKLNANACTSDNLRIIKTALKNRRKRPALLHLPRINPSVIDLLSLPGFFLNYSLLLKVSESSYPPYKLSELCLDIDALRTQQGIHPNWPFRAGPICPQILERHRAKLERRVAAELSNHNVELPPPPLSGIRAKGFHIEPLTTIREIFREGHKMHNCIAAYVRHVAAGSHYIYRLLVPQRATVLLIRRLDDWYPIQTRTFNNRAVEENTIKAIHTFTGTNPVELKNTDHDFPF